MDDTEPLSLVTMWTPPGLTASEQELTMRAKVVEMGVQYSEEVECVIAIKDICKRLWDKGYECVEREGSCYTAIEEQVVEVCSEARNIQLIVDYHYLLWRTAGEEKWTLERETGQCHVQAFLPQILLATQMRMTAETVTNGESLEIADDGERDTSPPLWNSNWKEIGILEFLNGTGSCQAGAGTSAMTGTAGMEGLNSRNVVRVVTSKDRMITWRGSRESDELMGEVLFTNVEEEKYTRTDTDYRKLNEHLPPALENMVLGQLASEYRLLQPSQHGFEWCKNVIDPESGLGPDSAHFVAGTRTRAPECFMLTNKKIMKLRTERKAALLLLSAKAAHKHGNQILWSPWRNLEEVTGEQEVEETEEQRQRRLEIFPMSLYYQMSEEEED